MEKLLDDEKESIHHLTKGNTYRPMHHETWGELNPTLSKNEIHISPL